MLRLNSKTLPNAAFTPRRDVLSQPCRDLFRAGTAFFQTAKRAPGMRLSEISQDERPPMRSFEAYLEEDAWEAET
jgi:hypothetical protein